MTVARGSKTLRTRDLVSGAAAGVVGGYVGTKVMNPVTTKLYEMAPEKDKQREKAVSPGSPYRIGAQKAADLLGVSLTEEQLNAAALHGRHHRRLALRRPSPVVPPQSNRCWTGLRDGHLRCRRRGPHAGPRIERARPRVSAVDAPPRVPRASCLWRRRGGDRRDSHVRRALAQAATRR